MVLQFAVNVHRLSTDEYLGNTCTSVGGPAAIAHACILPLGSSISKTSLESCFDKGSKMMHWSPLVTKSVECYMKEWGVSERRGAKSHKGAEKAFVENAEQGDINDQQQQQKQSAKCNGEGLWEHGEDFSLHIPARRRDRRFHRAHPEGRLEWKSTALYCLLQLCKMCMFDWT